MNEIFDIMGALNIISEKDLVNLQNIRIYRNLASHSSKVNYVSKEIDDQVVNLTNKIKRKL